MEDRLASLAESMRALADTAAAIRLDALPPGDMAALERMILDSLGVAIAGTRTPEFDALVTSWPYPVGEVSIWGTPHRTDVDTAALFNGVAICTLELDEGNKFARGHPGAHVLPAAIAEAQRIGTTGHDLLAAIVAGYEVAARLAAAFQPHAGLHPHGHWGAIGAAAAVARLHGGNTESVLASMDAAAGLLLASPFSSALDGSFVRNLWVGTAAVNGLHAARLVMAGLGSNDLTARSTLDGLLGAIDTDALRAFAAGDLLLSGGYIKRHASCAYTHPPADAALALVEAHGPVAAAGVTSITVHTHSLAAGLARRTPASRLAAMFSIPHVVATALAHGDCRPERFEPDALRRPDLVALRDLVTVAEDPEMSARLPAERRARVTVERIDGTVHSAEVPNAIGDSAHHPFDRDRVRAKLVHLLGASDAAYAVDATDALFDDRPVGEAIAHLDNIRPGTELRPA